jgi:hypothetical protein
MKYSPLLPQVALVLAVVYACSDSAAPANSHALVTPTGLAGDVGKPPPPPVETVIAVSVESPGFAVFTGIYFTNGEITEDGSGTIPTFDGMAWLRFDNKQPDLGGTTSANARFMAKDMNYSGSGTLFIQGIAYKIVSVENFTRFSACGDSEDNPSGPCAIIEFTATDEAGGEHTGRAVAFDRANCLEENKKGDLILVCEEGGSVD